MKPLKSGPPTLIAAAAVARTYVAVRRRHRGAVPDCRRRRPAFRARGTVRAAAGLAMATSAAKIDLPLGRSQSNLSLSHAVNFWALLALGPAEAVCIATMSAWAQCTLRVGVRNPLHRILFNIGSLTLTVWLAGLPLPWLMSWGSPGFASFARSRGGHRPAVFLHEHLPGRAGDCAVDAAAGVAGLAPQLPLERTELPRGRRACRDRRRPLLSRGWFGWLALLALPLYLVFRSYHTVVSRLREEQDETRRAMDVQLATIEALALAIEAQGRLYARAHSIDPAVRGDARRGRRAFRCRRAGGANRRPAARRREHGGSRAHPVEARGAHAGRVRARQDPSARRRRHSAERAVRRTGQRSGPLPSRAVGRPRLSGGPAGHGHPDWAHASWRSPIATAPCRPTPVSPRTQRRAKRSRSCANMRAPRSIPARRTVHRALEHFGRRRG